MKYPQEVGKTILVIGVVIELFHLFQIIGHAKECYASERSEVNPASKEMILKTRNVSRVGLFIN